MQEQPPPPQWAPPPQQPGYGAPPPGMWGGPGYAAPPSRPLGVTLSAALFLFFAVLLLLGAVIVMAGGALFASAFGAEGAGFLAGAGIVIGVIILLFSLLFFAVGIGLLRGKGWARIGGLILAVLGLLGGISSLAQGGGGGSLAYGIVMTLIYAGVIWALWTAGPYFAARR